MFDSNPNSIHYARETNVMYRIYAWMCAALALSASVAYYVSINPAIYMAIYKNQILLIGLIVAQLALVVAISGFIQKISYPVAVVLFLLYAASVGLTLSSIFIVFTQASIFITFIVTASMFGAMACYGYFTKADLTTMGSICIMALFGLIIASLVNLYFKSPAFQFLLSGAGVLIFTLLTAYDVQKLKQLTQSLAADSQTMAKVAIVGALTLYLDFINLFLFLLNIMGRRKE